MIGEYENTLRRLIIDILGGEDSVNYKVSVERIEKWKERREIEVKKNKGVNFENRILYYSDFYDLKSIILKYWELFVKVLHDKKRFEVFYSELENYRNTIAHGRNLTLSQENLLKGIVLDLKNQITIYHNKNEMKEDFFIRIIKINDNLGNIWDSILANPNPTLRVGDDYELTIEANDPKGRKMAYKIFTLGNFRIEQNSNRFNFKISNSLVGKNATLYVTAFTPESEYKNEAIIMIGLTVLPN
ncbi:MAG: hypothetical protein JWQ27_2199 [Ferruginibacter sp.]|nr:hypothetical protein [Ferruginibacter sp.]